MTQRSSQFAGSIPEIYDQHLGPVFFPGYAADMAARVKVGEGARVLELAGGTGISSRYLRDAMPETAVLVVTDLNQDMLKVAKKKFAADENVVFQPADATSLPYEDNEFDAVASQFGVMFFPDKGAAFSEMARVLKPGGALVFNVWESPEENPIASTVAETIFGFMPEGTPNFFNVPFGFNDRDVIRELMEAANFSDIEFISCPMEATAESAAHAAKGFVQGNPVILDIRDNPDINEDEVTDAVAAALRDLGGDNPVRGSMLATVVTAKAPG